jgi:hypothetical protein
LIKNVIGTLLVGPEFLFKQIGEENQLENREHDEKFDDDDNPELPAQRHAPEAVQVELEDGFQEFHGMRGSRPALRTGAGDAEPEKEAVPILNTERK